MGGSKFTSPSSAFSLRKLNGGLNSSFSPVNIQDNEASDLLNIDFDKFGSFIKRNGYDTLNTSAFNSGAKWTGLHWFEMSDGSKFLTGTCGSKLAKMDDLDGTWDDITGALTVNTTALNTFRTYRDMTIGTNGTNAVFKWVGSGNGAVLGGLAGGGSAPTINWSKWVEIFSNYTILANFSESSTPHRSRFMWSAIGTTETWDVADFIDVNRDDGQEITGIQVLGNRLIIFKRYSIFAAVFTGDADIPFIVEQTQSHVGCESGYSIQPTDNGLIFLSQDGYYFFDGNNSTKLSDRINNTIDTFNRNLFSNSVSIYQKQKNRYWSAQTLSGGSSNSRAITFDTFNNAFSLYKGHNIASMCLVYVSGQERVYFGDYSGYVYRADIGTEDNPLNVETTFSSYLYTKWFDYGDLASSKATTQIFVYYQIASAIITLTYAYDLNLGDQYQLNLDTSTSADMYDTAIYDTATYASQGGDFQRKDLTGRGRVIRFGFKNGTLDETMQVDGFGLWAHQETIN